MSSVDGLPLQHPRPQVASSGPPPVTDADLEANISGPRTAPGSSFAGQQGSGRLRDPFEDSPATAPMSQKQQSRFVGEDDSQATQAAWRREKRPHNTRVPSDHRYPRTGTEDDREESISLVRSPSVETTDTEDEDVRRGGIRLVEPPPGSGRF